MIRAQRLMATGCLAAGLLLMTAMARAERPVLSPNSPLPHPEGSTELPLKPSYLKHVVNDTAAVTIEPVVGRTDADDAPDNGSETGEKSDADQTPATASEPEKPKRELSPAVAALRDQVRRMLTLQQKQPFNTRDSSPNDIMHFCMGFGCATEVSLEGAGGKKINGITSLCWNYPCAGFEMLVPASGHVAARIGYGCQESPGEFLAMLAMSRVPPTYPIRSGKTTSTIADLVVSEQLGCRNGADMSRVLIGLTYYAASPQWKNDLGEDWSIDRIIRHEIALPIVSAPDGGVNRLMGLSYVVDHRIDRDLPIDGQYRRAQKYVSDFHEFALGMQNSDGSWGPAMFAARSTTADAAVQLWTTGRVLEWLALSLPDDRLEDPRVIRTVEQVTRLLASQRYQRNVPMLPAREIVAFGHALHGLSIYDDRVFKPADGEPKPVAEQPATVEKPKAVSPGKVTTADHSKSAAKAR